MEISPEELKEIKKQLIEQINTTVPEEKRQETIGQIESMDDTQLIEFLKQNNLIKEGQENIESKGKCIFCSIVFGEVPSTKIAENEKAIAILELNPISEGHTIIIPKNHLEKESDLDEQTKSLGEHVKGLIQNSLNPKEIQLIPGNVMGHQIINILPIYANETINSPKSQKTPEELEKLRDKITKQNFEEQNHKKVEKIIEKPQEKQPEINEKNTWLPKRIP